MQELDLIIITCPRLASKRLGNSIEQLLLPISHGLINTVTLITGSEYNYERTLGIAFRKSLWYDHLEVGWDHFRENIIYSPQLRGTNEAVLKDLYFRSRSLTKNERSICYRHIYAWHLAASRDCPVLILEDDIHINSMQKLTELLRFFRLVKLEFGYADLADNYIPITKNRDDRLLSKTLNIYQTSEPKTRTLSAYMVCPSLAKDLLAHSSCISLPIDMHLQYLLVKLGITGLYIEESPFSHGSKNGTLKSEI